jgi:RNA polymerase sigma-70 factor (ECF subfamily)
LRARSAAALADLDELGGALGSYHLFHATRAQLLRELGRTAEARRADEQALGLTGNPAERALLEQRLASPGSPARSAGMPQ